ncbi:MAG: SGNH/GDSL hydrolase family protein [Lachnospiraceae bacterium]|nr:SGNH/GDSL hydrolase family protein [Lachnospiraceae bacterium]
MKKKVLAVIMTVTLAATVLTGCKYRITDQSVEDEVAEAIAAVEAEWNEKYEAEHTARLAAEEIAAKDGISAENVEIEAPDESAMTDNSLNEVTIEPTTADSGGNTETAVEDVDPFQIVFIGDSIFDAVRDETGIARMVGAELGADIYNLAIGGTSAGVTREKSVNFDTWTEPNFTGIVYAMEGKVARSILDGYKSGEVMSGLNPSKTDYFIIQYGTNDFLSYIPIGAPDIAGQYYFYYSSAMLMGIRELKDNYPDATIIICTPYYEQFWSADRTRFIGDIHSVNNGYGTLLDYINCARDIAAAEGCECLNMYDLMAIDTYNVEKMTEDGIHPNQEARVKYASILIDKIRELEYAKENPEAAADE